MNRRQFLSTAAAAPCSEAPAFITITGLHARFAASSAAMRRS